MWFESKTRIKKIKKIKKIKNSLLPNPASAGSWLYRKREREIYIYIYVDVWICIHIYIYIYLSKSKAVEPYTSDKRTNPLKKSLIEIASLGVLKLLGDSRIFQKKALWLEF